MPSGDRPGCLRCGIHLGCGSVRGCCQWCYERCREAVKRQETTWERLVADGKVRPPKPA